MNKFIVKPCKSIHDFYHYYEDEVYGFCEAIYGHKKRNVGIIVKDIGFFSQFFEVSEHESIHSAICELNVKLDINVEHNIIRRMMMFDYYETIKSRRKKIRFF